MRLDEMWGQNNQQNQPRQAVQPSPVMIQVWILIVDKRALESSLSGNKDLLTTYSAVYIACLGIKIRFKCILVTV